MRSDELDGGEVAAALVRRRVAPAARRKGAGGVAFSQKRAL